MRCPSTARRGIFPRVTVFVVLLTASTSFLILSGLLAFAMLLWRGPSPPPAPVIESAYVDDPGPLPGPTDSPPPGPGLDDPDPGSDVWTEFDRQRDPALV